MNDKPQAPTTNVPKLVGRKVTSQTGNIFEDRLKAVGATVKDAHASLVTGDLARNKLPEEIFKNYFLPLFAGLETHSDISVGVWVSIAGTPFAEVDIIDTNGQVLFTVPSILERNIIDPTKPANVPLSTVTDTVEKMIRQSPKRAAAFLNHHLSELTVSDNVLAEHQQRNFERLDVIFKRYGVTPAWGFDGNSTATSPVKSDGPKKTLPMSVDEDIL